MVSGNRGADDGRTLHKKAEDALLPSQINPLLYTYSSHSVTQSC